MKTKLFFLLFLICFGLSAQTLPNIESLSGTSISGTGKVGTTVRIDTNNDGDYSDVSVVVDDKGFFRHTFATVLAVGSVIRIKSSIVKNGKANESKPLTLIIQDKNSLGVVPTASSMAVEFLNKKNEALKNSILIYKATISNTNFSIPIARFNFNDTSTDNALGNVTLFTSIGAGVGLSWGRMEITRDDTGQITNEEYSNTIGFHIGVLFSSGTGEDTKNVFAPTLNMALLDFQIGLGYELGTVGDNQSRTFLTVSYAIPLYKLVRKGYRVWKINPYPIASRKGSNLN
ncbi:hypothetical protein [Flavobacterium suzhouense]|uniref:Uncharacterized protein n=1 Tax=Flavobacterium suzhouense TaxID=1529638 RepID=A0ABW5NW42_9FLAO